MKKQIIDDIAMAQRNLDRALGDVCIFTDQIGELIKNLCPRCSGHGVLGVDETSDETVTCPVCRGVGLFYKGDESP